MNALRKTAVLIAALAIGGYSAASALAADEAAPATGQSDVTYKEFIEGNPEAKVTVVEYASLTCSHCANFYIIGLIFKNQGEFFSNPNDAMRGYAQLAGMTSEEVDACLKNKSVFDEIERVATTAVNVYKVRATPTFFVNDQIVEGEVWETLKAAIDDALADAD